MAVISVRLNEEEEKKIEYLSQFFNEEKSTLLKHSINDMFEDILDREVIEKFEVKEKKKQVIFVKAKDILRDIR